VKNFYGGKKRAWTQYEIDGGGVENRAFSLGFAMWRSDGQPRKSVCFWTISLVGKEGYTRKEKGFGSLIERAQFA